MTSRAILKHRMERAFANLMYFHRRGDAYAMVDRWKAWSKSRYGR